MVSYLSSIVVKWTVVASDTSASAVQHGFNSGSLQKYGKEETDCWIKKKSRNYPKLLGRQKHSCCSHVVQTRVACKNILFGHETLRRAGGTNRDHLSGVLRISGIFQAFSYSICFLAFPPFSSSRWLRLTDVTRFCVTSRPYNIPQSRHWIRWDWDVLHLSSDIQNNLE